MQYIWLQEGRRRILGRKWKHMGLNNTKIVSRMTEYFMRIGELRIGRCQNIGQEDCRLSYKMTNYLDKKSSIFGRRTAETTYYVTWKNGKIERIFLPINVCFTAASALKRVNIVQVNAYWDFKFRTQNRSEEVPDDTTPPLQVGLRFRCSIKEF